MKRSEDIAKKQQKATKGGSIFGEQFGTVPPTTPPRQPFPPGFGGQYGGGPTPQKHRIEPKAQKVEGGLVNMAAGLFAATTALEMMRDTSEDANEAWNTTIDAVSGAATQFIILQGVLKSQQFLEIQKGLGNALGGIRGKLGGIGKQAGNFIPTPGGRGPKPSSLAFLQKSVPGGGIGRAIGAPFKGIGKAFGGLPGGIATGGALLAGAGTLISGSAKKDIARGVDATTDVAGGQAVSSAGIGAAVGSLLGPIGTGVGAAAGALYGWTTGLVKSRQELETVRIGMVIESFGKSIQDADKVIEGNTSAMTAFNKAFTDLTAAVGGTAGLDLKGGSEKSKGFFSRIGGLVTHPGRKLGNIAADTFYDADTGGESDKRREEIREAARKNLTPTVDILNRIVKQGGQLEGTGGSLEKTFGISTISGVFDRLAATTGDNLSALRTSTALLKDSNKSQTQVIASYKRMIVANKFADAVERAAVRSDKFANAVGVAEGLLSGANFTPQFTIDPKDAKQLGAILPGGEQFGKQAANATAIQSALPRLVAQVFTNRKGPLTGEEGVSADFSTLLRGRGEATLTAKRAFQKAVEGKEGDIKGGGAVALQGVIDDVSQALDAYKKVNIDATAAAEKELNALSSTLGKGREQILKGLTAYQKLSDVALKNAELQAKANPDKFPGGVSGKAITTAARGQLLPLLRGTGVGVTQNLSVDVAKLTEVIKTNQQKVFAIQTNKDGKLSPEKVKEQSDAILAVTKTSLALETLTDASKLAAGALKTIDDEQKQREGRRSIALEFATGSAADRRKIGRASRAAELIARNNSFEGLSSDSRKAGTDYLQRLKSSNLLFNNRDPDAILNKALEGSSSYLRGVGGEGVTRAGKIERQAQSQISRLGKQSVAAQQGVVDIQTNKELIDLQVAAFKTFVENTQPMVQALKSFPDKIDFSVEDFKVDVRIFGGNTAEVENAFSELINTQVVNEINRFIANKMPHLGKHEGKTNPTKRGVSGGAP
ncbi:MAG: hypothetical protein HN929_11000 [Chloroflexi bacterium]|nr:hypothetical protein [Chloroflexota bacterium]